MTQQDYKRTFDTIRSENLHQVFAEQHYTITDVSCMYREQERLSVYSPYPLHVADVEFDPMMIEDIY